MWKSMLAIIMTILYERVAQQEWQKECIFACIQSRTRRLECHANVNHDDDDNGDDDDDDDDDDFNLIQTPPSK